jgi:hypothetical protein
MKYRYYLIISIILFLGAGGAFAQDTRYRVELLVLTHLNHGQEPRAIKHLPDYSPATDFLTPPEEEAVEEEEASGAAIEEAAEPQLDLGPLLDPETGELLEVEEGPDPNALVHIEEMSEVMQEAWRRLRLSAPFRPEQYLSWEQGSEAPFPALRVHDLAVVSVDDPYAELRVDIEAQGRADTEDESVIVFADAAGMDALSEIEPPALPDPTLYYRLDGSAVLRRTRFLHLDLDLQLREPVREEALPATYTPQAEEFERPPPSSFLVHELKQSRQVKSGRMEYFDGPVLGVLAFSTSIEIEEGDTP